MHEYMLRITDENDMIILTPKMITLLIEKIRNSDKKELCIPAAEILPQGYTEYLIRVLEANRETGPAAINAQEVCALIAEQIQTLHFDQQKCFDEVNLYAYQHQMQFHLNTNEEFYMLVKQQTSLQILRNSFTTNHLEAKLICKIFL